MSVFKEQVFTAGGRPSAKHEKGVRSQNSLPNRRLPKRAKNRATDAKSAPPPERTMDLSDRCPVGHQTEHPTPSLPPPETSKQPHRQTPRGLKTEHPTPSLPPSRGFSRDSGGPRTSESEGRGGRGQAPNPTHVLDIFRKQLTSTARMFTSFAPSFFGRSFFQTQELERASHTRIERWPTPHP